MRVSVFIITTGSNKAAEKFFPIYIQMHFHSKMFERKITTGSDKAPVQRAKQTRGWELVRPSLELRSCLSSPLFFHKAADTMLSNHCIR